MGGRHTNKIQTVSVMNSVLFEYTCRYTENNLFCLHVLTVLYARKVTLVSHFSQYSKVVSRALSYFYGQLSSLMYELVTPWVKITPGNWSSIEIHVAILAFNASSVNIIFIAYSKVKIRKHTLSVFGDDHYDR